MSCKCRLALHRQTQLIVLCSRYTIKKTPRKHGIRPHPTVIHPPLPTPFTQEITGSNPVGGTDGFAVAVGGRSMAMLRLTPMEVRMDA